MDASKVAKCLGITLLLCHVTHLAQGQPDSCTKPDSALMLPPGAVVMDTFIIAGSQNYTCDAASGTYTLLGAEGTMLDDKVTGFVISAPIPGQGVGGIYTKTDPATNATVGSIAAVREDLVASPSNTTAIPWFIRQATATSGIYDGAEFIWRHDTLGGVLPEETNNCTVGQSEVVRVPYNAAYTVYKCGNGTAPSSGSMKVTVSVLALIAAGAVASTALVW